MIRGPVALDLHQQRQSFRGNFRVGQNIFYRGQLGFRQEKRVWLPVEQTFVKQFLRMNAGTEDPDRGIDSVSVIGWKSMARVRDYGGQKRLCRLYNVGKLLPATAAFRDRGKFAARSVRSPRHIPEALCGSIFPRRILRRFIADL